MLKDCVEFQFLRSALTPDRARHSQADLLAWLERRRQDQAFSVEKIPFSQMSDWGFDSATGNLHHKTGRFFSIEGLRVRTNFGKTENWTQPIINQPEIGILGILTRKFNDVQHFLLQAKMEPGNLGVFQLSPTVQATRSNFTQAHGGRKVPFLEYFTDSSKGRILVDVLQSEQGGRFLQKRNRNMIVEITNDIPESEDFRWLTLSQIFDLIKQDNLINMDTRTVLSSISLFPVLEPKIDFSEWLSHCGSNPWMQSYNPESYLHSMDEVLAWLTAMKFKYSLDVERIPLNRVDDWIKSDFEIAHKTGRFFSIVAVKTHALNREVSSWHQPLIQPKQKGLMAYFIKTIKNIPHFLVQAKVEPGNFDVVELAPTIQAITGDYQSAAPTDWPPFLEDLLNQPHRYKIIHDSMQSEEGGRFYKEENRNLIVQVGDDFPLAVPENYKWMTLNQLKTLIRFNNFINVEGRCLLACLDPR